MSQWSRTLKPKNLSSTQKEAVFGVDAAEVVATPGIAQPGWVKRTVSGTRVKWETLVAMKTPPTDVVAGDITDDVEVLPNYLITLTTQPASLTVAAPAAAEFTVVAAQAPAGGPTLTYAWQRDVESVWTAIANGGVYSGATTDTLTISDSTGLSGESFRCVVDSTNAQAVTSNAATLTVTVTEP
jgi:hypothetical protein